MNIIKLLDENYHNRELLKLIGLTKEGLEAISKNPFLSYCYANLRKLFA